MQRQKKRVSLVINQSWDRMVTKGYPTVEPDYLIVWNEHMKDEAVRYLDCHPENVFVEGAAPFDFIFRKTDIPSKEDFLKRLTQVKQHSYFHCIVILA